MIVKNKIKKLRTLGKEIYSAKYGSFDVDSGILTIRETPYLSSNDNGLKDIEYVIHNSTLYITATRTQWLWVGWWSPVNLRGNLYQLSEERIKILIIPDECFIKNKRAGFLWRKRKFLVDVNKNPNGHYFERNDQSETNIVIKPFKIIIDNE